MVQTKFEFTLPTGYLDSEGNLHRKGIMRRSRAVDEIDPLKDERVQVNPAYSTIIILARVIVKLGALEEVTPEIIEELFADDLNYLHRFYRQVNGLLEE